MGDPFAKTVTATVMGIELVLWSREAWERRDDPRDLWMPRGPWDGPQEPAPISEWPKIIQDWQVAKQVAAGFEVWDIHDDRPKYWHKRPAVFRSGRTKDQPNYYGSPTHIVHTRNGAGDPDSLYRIERGNCAPDTPDMEAIKAEAMRLYDEAVEAGKRLKAYMRAVPRLSEEQWLKLPIKPGTE